VAFIALRRPPWIKIAGDRWTEVNNTAAAADAIGAKPRRVFVALGRNDLAPFIAASQHVYLFRSVDPIDPPLPLPKASYITARGPFSEADDRALMESHGIEVVIAKNSGGEAAYGKIAAARGLKVEVILVRRPITPAAPAVGTIDAVVEWLDHAFTTAVDRGV
jgi:precorrin-6A/cobalt-precorrin-6A reductase